MVPDLFPILVDIRSSVGLYAVMTPELLKQELVKRAYPDAEVVSRIMAESHDQFTTTRTKPRLNELRNLSTLISRFTDIDQKKVLFVLNDLNDCIFRDTIAK